MDNRKIAELLERFATTWCSWDADAFVDLYAPDAESHDDPFAPPLTGHEAIRQNMLALSAIEDEVTFATGRHWYVAPTVLAEWTASYTHRATGETVGLAGFLAFDLDGDGRIRTARFWYNRETGPAAHEDGLQ
jgi:SnoaL-like domain